MPDSTWPLIVVMIPSPTIIEPETVAVIMGLCLVLVVYFGVGVGSLVET